jgi:hypothetical protein
MVKASVMTANILTLRQLKSQVHPRRAESAENVINWYHSRTVVLFKSAQLMLERWADQKTFHKADKPYRTYSLKHESKETPTTPQTEKQSKGATTSKRVAEGINELQHIPVPEDRDELKQQVIDLYSTRQIRTKTEATSLIKKLQDNSKLMGNTLADIKKKIVARRIAKASQVDPAKEAQQRKEERQQKKQEEQEEERKREEEQQKTKPKQGEKPTSERKRQLFVFFEGYYDFLDEYHKRCVDDVLTKYDGGALGYDHCHQVLSEVWRNFSTNWACRNNLPDEYFIKWHFPPEVIEQWARELSTCPMETPEG